MTLIVTIQKKIKTLDDAQLIYEKIQQMSFFRNFSSNYLSGFSLEDLILLCQSLEYEKMTMGNYVFRNGDVSDKFYIIFSGQIAITLPGKEEIPRIKAVRDKSLDRLKSKTPIFSRSNKDNNPTSKTPLKDQRATRFSSKQIPLTRNCLNKEFYHKNQIEPSEAKKALEYNSRNEQSSWKEAINQMPNEEEMNKNLTSHDDLLASKDKGLTFYLKQGESFGEFALKSDKPRSTSALCKTDCELLVLTKQMFDIIKAREKIRKEDLLRSVFPFFKSDVMTQLDYENIMNSFKIETYKKGDYLTIEEKCSDKDKLLSVVAQGKCLVQRNLCAENQDQGDRTILIQIAIISKGALIGEETLFNNGQYGYTVKALSNLTVYSADIKVFDSEIFKKFRDYLTKIYKKKKKHRDTVYENRKKEYESCVTDSNSPLIKNYSFNKISQKFNPEAILSQKSQNLNRKTLTEAYLKHLRSKSEVSVIHENTNGAKEEEDSEDSSSNQVAKSFKDKRRVINVCEAEDPEKLKIERKIDFLSKIPDPIKNPRIAIEKNEIECMKFFGSNKARNRKLCMPKDRSIGIDGENNSSLFMEKKNNSGLGDSILSEFVKETKKYKLLNKDLVDLKGTPIAEESPNDRDSLYSTSEFVKITPSFIFQKSDSEKLEKFKRTPSNPHIFKLRNSTMQGYSYKRPISNNISPQESFAKKLGNTLDMNTSESIEPITAEASPININKTTNFRRKIQDRIIKPPKRSVEVSVNMLNLESEIDITPINDSVQGKFLDANSPSAAILSNINQQFATSFLSRLKAKYKGFYGNHQFKFAEWKSKSKKISQEGSTKNSFCNPFTPSS